MDADRLGPPGPVLLRGIDSVAVDSAWSRYERDRTKTLRDELAARHWQLVRFAARRLALGLPGPPSERVLACDGKAGLIAAIETYDRVSSQRFELSALRQIRSSIIHTITNGGEMPYSRFWLREKVEQTLTARLGRAPTREERELEVAAWGSRPAETMPLPFPSPTVGALDALWTVSDVDVDRISLLDAYPEEHAYRLRRHRPHMEVWDWLIGLANDSVRESLGSEEAARPRDWIAEAMSKLNDSDRLLLWLFYYENMRVMDIGGLISLASGIIPRVTNGAVLRLRASLSSLPGSLWNFADDPEGMRFYE